MRRRCVGYVRDLWMYGSTPPPAIVARISASSSSSPRIASCRWRGVIRFTRRSLDALPGAGQWLRSGGVHAERTRKLEHLGGEVLKDGARVYGRLGTHTHVVLRAALEVPVNTAHRELFAGGQHRAERAPGGYVPADRRAPTATRACEPQASARVPSCRRYLPPGCWWLICKPC